MQFDYVVNRYSIIFRNIRSVWYLIIAVIASSLAYAYLRLLVPLYIGDSVNYLVSKNYTIILHFALLIFAVTVVSQNCKDRAVWKKSYAKVIVPDLYKKTIVCTQNST